MGNQGYRRARILLTGIALLAALWTTGSTAVAGLTAVPADIVLHAAQATTVTGHWQLVDDPQAASGRRLWNPDQGAAKLATPLAAPANYFELTFQAEANTPYRIWIRGRADRDYWGNDSVYMQFSDSVSSTGAAANRIGTTQAIWLGIEDGSNCGLSGWGWQDDGYGVGVLGPLVYFATTGSHTLRVQQREDGISVDQIVLSSSQYLTSAPGKTKNDTTILPATAAGEPAPSPTGAIVEVLFDTTQPTAVAGAWRALADSGAAAGTAIGTLDTGGAKITTAAAAPASYVEFTFNADAGLAYRLWLRGRAERDYYGNDSVFVQFADSVDSSGAPTARIGTTGALVVNLEDCSGCGLSGWGWQDTGYGAGVLGPLVRFAASGVHTMRIQTREDGYRIDQIVLSAERYLTSAPGGLKNDATILTSGAPAPTPIPTPTPVPGTAVRLRVLQWNLHHGVGTDGVYDIQRIADWIVRMNPDVVTLNEVEKYTGWGNEDQPERYRTMLQQKTGRTWYMHFTQEYGDWTSNGKGHVILSVYPFDATGHACLTPSSGLNGAGAMGEATITVNGRPLNIVVSHLDPSSLTMRLTQAQETIAYAATFAENRLITGDMNAWPDQSSIAEFNKTYNDSWAVAEQQGVAVHFAGLSPSGATKKGRIDYIFYSKTAPNLTLVESRVFDTRDASGVMPSDHRPVLSTFDVR